MTEQQGNRGFDCSIWDATYAGGGQMNRYPADGVVSLVYKLMRDKERSQTNVLEVGCGAGNNAWFFAREGFNITAVDGSNHCLEYARKRFADDGLTGTFAQMGFLDLDKLSGTYDLILDRQALSSNHWDDLVQIMPKINKLMHDDSIFLSFMFTADHPDKKYMGRCEKGATWLDPQGPVFGGVRWITLLDEAHLRELYSPFTIVDLYKRNLDSLVRDEPYLGDSEWIIICKKKK